MILQVTKCKMRTQVNTKKSNADDNRSNIFTSRINVCAFAENRVDNLHLKDVILSECFPQYARIFHSRRWCD